MPNCKNYITMKTTTKKTANKSNSIAKIITNNSTTFKGCRSTILAASADGIIKNCEIIKKLRSTKNDEVVNSNIIARCEFTYQGEEHEGAILISKKFTVKSVLNASENEFNEPLLPSEVYANISAENAKKALTKCKNDIEATKKSVAFYNTLLENAKSDLIIEELTKKHDSLVKQLSRKVAILEAVKSL